MGEDTETGDDRETRKEKGVNGNIGNEKGRENKGERREWVRRGIRERGKRGGI